MHLTDELLDGLASDTLAGDDRLHAERHLGECDACRAELATLRALLTRARALPAAVEPPAGLWDDIVEVVAARRDARSVRPAASPPWLARRWALAAAALLLVAASSATTAWLLRARGAPSATAPVAAAPADREALAAFAAIEGDYAAAARTLAATLEERRGELSPETVASIERSLTTIDLAIREAREALARDPGNRAIVSLLAARWEQKVDLLRRSTELQPRS